MAETTIEAAHTSLRNFIDAVDQYRVSFHTLITNTEFPLDERWSLFQKAPDILREHRTSIIHLAAWDKYHIDPISDMDYSRHEHINIVDFVDELLEEVNAFSVDSADWHNFSDRVLSHYVDNPQAMAELKEELLEKNIGSFEYDW